MTLFAGTDTRDMLELIFERQAELQETVFGIRPDCLHGEERKQYVTAMGMGIMTEVGEALNEIPWKPWSRKLFENRKAYVGELVDVLHFWVNMLLVVGATPREVFEAYFAKAGVNEQRQLEGYDESKKDATGRALDEPYRS